MRASPQLGVSPNAIVRYLRKLGHRCSVRFEMTVEQLERFTRRGHPVIVAYQEWAHRPSTVDYSICWDNGHYSVVVGVVDDHVILVDPSSRRHKRKLDSQSFIAKWRDIETRGDKILRVYSRWGVAVGPRHIRRAENALVL
jgi:predicted double-glycine peptidase